MTERVGKHMRIAASLRRDRRVPQGSGITAPVAGPRNVGWAALLLAATTASMAAAPAHAGHDVFHIFTPVVEAEHWGVEALSAYQWGLPAAEEEEGAPPRVALELGVHAGVTEFWMAKLALSADQEDGGEFALTGIGFENVFRFSREARDPLDFAWFTAVGAGLDSGATNAVEFGPIVSVSSGSVSLVLNPFFEKTFGENREDGIAFTYAGRLTYELASQLNVGIEAYGEVENLGNAPHVRDQVHRIGPVLYLGTLHGAHSSSHGHSAHSQVSDGHDHKHAKHGHSEWHAEIGFLFGLTQATPDAALKLNVGLEF